MPRSLSAERGEFTSAAKGKIISTDDRARVAVAEVARDEICRITRIESLLCCGEIYTHSRAPFFHIQMYPTIRMPRNTSISRNPNIPSALN
jgi:hypothetical protein